MKSSILQASLRSTGHKVLMALAFASLISGLSISPALGANRKGGHQDNGLHKGESKANRDQPVYRPEYRRPYNYAQPVYVPPPVYYEPQQSPGISFFFPLDFRR